MYIKIQDKLVSGFVSNSGKTMAALGGAALEIQGIAGKMVAGEMALSGLLAMAVNASNKIRY